MSRTIHAPAYYGVRPEAGSAWLALTDALNRMEDNRQTPVCKQRPDQWTSDAHPAQRQDAAEACGFCDAAPACRAFAEANLERQHVWGGRDFTPPPQRRAA